MSALRTVGELIGTVALAVGFAGLGVLGIALMYMSVAFDTTILWRIVVFLLGFFGFIVAVGTGMAWRNRPTHP